MNITPESIRDFRERMELSRATFAMKLGYAESTLRHWESGTHAPSGEAESLLRQLFAYEEVLAMDPSYAVPGCVEDDAHDDDEVNIALAAIHRRQARPTHPDWSVLAPMPKRPRNNVPALAKDLEALRDLFVELGERCLVVSAAIKDSEARIEAAKEKRQALKRLK